MLIFWSWIAFIVTFVGAIFNARKDSFCFILWACTNVFWAVHNFRNKDYAQGFQYVMFFFTCIYGLLNWGAKPGHGKQ